MNKHLISLFIFCGTTIFTFIYAMEKQTIEKQNGSALIFTKKNYQYPNEVDAELLAQHKKACLKFLQDSQASLDTIQVKQLARSNHNLLNFKEMYMKTVNSAETTWKNECDTIWKENRSTLHAKILAMLSAVENIHSGFYKKAGEVYHDSSPQTTLDNFPIDKTKTKELHDLFTSAHEIKYYFKEIDALINSSTAGAQKVSSTRLQLGMY